MKALDALRHSRIAHHVATKAHHTEGFFHCTYLGAVAFTAHGVYAFAAGMLLVVILVGSLAHFLGE